jgi:hypothetical protein
MPVSVAARAGDGVAGPGTAGATIPAPSSAWAPPRLGEAPWPGEAQPWLGEVKPWLGEVQPKASRADK